MATSNTGENPREARLNEILAEYLQGRQRGEAPDRAELAAKHPEFAADLASFFADQDRFQQAAGPIKFAANAMEPTLATGHVDQASSLISQAGSLTYGPGQHVRYFGDYEIIEEIARGGMGVVYRARQVNLKRIVALKMVLAGQLATPQEIQRFYAEAEAAARLAHPNIVPIFEVGQHENQHYFSMAFVDGASLAHRIAQGVLEPREAARLMKDVAGAIAYAHVEGVIHRDLKPGNILIDRDGTPRVTDFGLAKRVEGEASGLTVTGQVLGTPSYMPPEQARGNSAEITQLSDVYSLGAVLYCLVTGRPPFQAANPVETLLQVMTHEPLSPRQLNPAVPLDLETIILKCLEKEPSRRYASAQHLVDELARFRDGRPILARPVSTAERSWRWCRRNPVVAGLAAAVLLSLVAGTGISAYFAFEARAQARGAFAEKRRADDNAATANDKAEESRAYLYIAEMKLARQAWKDADIPRVQEILDAQRPEANEEDLRGWEWYYLRSLCNTSRLTLEKTSCLAVAPRGSQVAVGEWFKQPGGRSQPGITIWDFRTGQRIGSLKGHSEGIWSAEWSRDGQRLATGGNDKTILIWDLSSKQVIRTLAVHDHVLGLAWSPDGTHIASRSGSGAVRVWSVETGQEITQLQQLQLEKANSIAWKPDGRQLAVSSGAQITLWDTGPWEQSKELTAHDSLTSSIAWSPDGTRLAAGGLGYDNQPVVVVWSGDFAQRRSLHGHRQTVSAVAWSPDGSRLASGSSDKTVCIWDAATGTLWRTLRGHSSGIRNLAWSEDGRCVISQGSDTKVWDVSQDQEAATIQSSERPLQVCWSPRGDHVAIGGSNDDVKVWNLDGHQQWSQPGARGPIAWSPDGEHLATAAPEERKEGNQQIALFSASRGAIVTTLPGHMGSLKNLAFSADGEYLASSSIGWRSIHNGKDVFHVKSDRVIRIWEVKAGRMLREIDIGTSDYYDCLAWSPTAPEICWVRNARFGIVDARNGQPRGEFMADTGIRCIAWSPGGDRVVLGFWSKNTLRIFDAKTGQPGPEFKGHAAPLKSVAWSSDPRRIASASEDGAVRIWDTATGQEVLAFAPSTLKPIEADSVCFSPNGQRLAAWQDGAAKIWDASPGYALDRDK